MSASPATTFAVAEKLRRIGALIGTGPKERYRARAFLRAADALEAYRGNLARLVETEHLTDLPGIGESIAREITQLAKTGTSEWLSKLENERGAEVDAKPRRARKKRPSLGEEGEMLLVDALETSDALIAFMRSNKAVRSVDLVGDAARGKETVQSVDLLATGPDADAIAKRFESSKLVDEIEKKTSPVGTVLVSTLYDGKIATLTIATENGRERALRKLLGPPSRKKLVALEDIRGAVHCHTVYSDGRATLEEMVRAAEKAGLEYITVTDHSPTAFYANGVQIDRLKKQWDEIERVQETTKVRIFRGTESDILRDGSLDYPDDILEKLDVIVASIHNRYRLDRRNMTERVVRALRHPLFKIWGHALGRLLLRRPAIDVDIDFILEVAAEERVAIELNGDPHRLDLPPDVAKKAKRLGIPFVISVDAHSTRDYRHLRTGVMIADRAGLAAKDVLNTLSAEEFAERVRPVAKSSTEKRRHRKAPKSSSKVARLS